MEHGLKLAPGYMITLLNGQRYFIETEHYPKAQDEALCLDGDLIYEVVIAALQDRLQCNSRKLIESPTKTIWIKIPQHAIATVEKISVESFIWQSVYGAKTRLVLPNAKDIQQGRQKFGRTK